MKLLPDENILVTSNADKIILTTYRIQMMDKSMGQSYTISMFLENISSIEIKYKSNIILLILAVLALIGGGLAGQQQSGPNNLFVAGLVAGATFLIIWWLTRKHIISITPDGGSSLDFMVQGMKEQQIKDFVYNVSLAKQNRVGSLYSK
ncbi:MAG: hypothetical protein ACJAUD_001273 [Crocinitomicaceae bacterium]|jgi:hypothetical protein